MITGAPLQPGVGRPAVPEEPVETLHASAVVAAPGVVALCARSGTGKSTLARRLHRRGYAIWEDDAVVWTASPVDGILTLAPGAETDTRPLAAVFVLERIDGNITPIANIEMGSAALTSVLPHAHLHPADDRRQREFLLRYIQLAATVPVVRVRFQPDASRIDALCDVIEQQFARIHACAAAV